ncbi:MAG: aminoacyl--tRNA ligase-related protein [Candidatus Woesearchaeota archaeon]
MPKIRNLIEKQDEYKQMLEKRKLTQIGKSFDEGVKVYELHKKKSQELQLLRAKLNRLSAEFNKTRDKELLKETKQVKDEINAREGDVEALEQQLAKIELVLPNWIAEGVLVGEGEAYEKPIEYRGKPKVADTAGFEKAFPGVEYEAITYKPLHHYDLVGKYIDQDKAAEIAQSRFYYEFDELVILDFALTMYALEFFRAKGYAATKLMITPFMMKKAVEERITYFEAFQDTIFEIEKEGLLLIPSSEHSIVAYYENRIFEDGEFPLRVMAWSPCFRREAGSHGKDTKGIFRVKQFHKVEIHSIVKEGKDFEELEQLRKDIQEFMDSLGLANRSVVVPTVDMDKRALQQIDIQAWMPGQGKFVETHSVATMGTWLSEKLMMRYRVGNEKEQVRNLYATAVAIQRMMCVIVENYYDAKNNYITIPDPLKKYMMGVERIDLGIN